MNHLTVMEAVENFPVIEEEETGGTPAPHTTPSRRPVPSHSFTTITSDEIMPALSVDGCSSEDEEPLIKRKLVPAPPDGGYGWVIVFAAFLSNFVLDGISVSQGALMEDIRKASGIINSTGNGSCVPPANCTPIAPVYEITVAMYGLISSVLLCVTLVAGPFISVLIDTLGFRKVALGGSLLAALGIFLSWACSPGKPNIWAIVACFGGITGLGFGMMFQTTVIIVGMYFDKWRPLATGIAMMGTGAGTIIFPPLLSVISKTWSWKAAYLFQAGIALLSASFALLYFPVPMKPSEPSPDSKGSEEGGPSDDEEFGIASMFKAMKSLLRSPTFTLTSISGAITMLGFWGPYAFLVDKAMKEIHVDEHKATFLLSIVGISNTTSRLLFGLISCHPWVNSLILQNGALTVIGIATMLMPLTTAYYQLVIYSIIFGIGLAIFTVLRPIIVLKLMGLDKFNNAFGLSLLFMGIGTLIGNPLGGWLKDSTGNYDISFYAAGGYLVLSAILCYPVQHVRDWENKGRIPTIVEPLTPHVLDEQRFVQRRYSLSTSLHL